jgi:hypothetical protein
MRSGTAALFRTFLLANGDRIAEDAVADSQW